MPWIICSYIVDTMTSYPALKPLRKDECTPSDCVLNAFGCIIVCLILSMRLAQERILYP